MAAGAAPAGGELAVEAGLGDCDCDGVGVPAAVAGLGDDGFGGAEAFLGGDFAGVGVLAGVLADGAGAGAGVEAGEVGALGADVVGAEADGVVVGWAPPPCLNNEHPANARQTPATTVTLALIQTPFTGGRATGAAPRQRGSCFQDAKA